MKNIKRDLKLLLKSPKDYLFSFTYSKEKKVVMHPFDAEVLFLAKKLKQTIEKNIPEAKLFLLGSTPLKLPGTGDIDLFVTSASKSFENTRSKIELLIGKPYKEREKYIIWKSEYEGVETQIVLTTPENGHVQMLIKQHEVLKKKENLKKYKKLKENLSGSSEREYTRGRMEFFNHLNL